VDPGSVADPLLPGHAPSPQWLQRRLTIEATISL
jgi:hypothetical protein